MSVIRRFALDVAERFNPEMVVLFGSYAYGRPHQDSDVDILVVMPARNQIDQAVADTMVAEGFHTVLRAKFGNSHEFRYGNVMPATKDAPRFVVAGLWAW